MATMPNGFHPNNWARLTPEQQEAIASNATLRARASEINDAMAMTGVVPDWVSTGGGAPTPGAAPAGNTLASTITPTTDLAGMAREVQRSDEGLRALHAIVPANVLGPLQSQFQSGQIGRDAYVQQLVAAMQGGQPAGNTLATATPPAQAEPPKPPIQSPGFQWPESKSEGMGVVAQRINAGEDPATVEAEFRQRYEGAAPAPPPAPPPPVQPKIEDMPGYDQYGKAGGPTFQDFIAWARTGQSTWQPEEPDSKAWQEAPPKPPAPPTKNWYVGDDGDVWYAHADGSHDHTPRPGEAVPTPTEIQGAKAERAAAKPDEPPPPVKTLADIATQAGAAYKTAEDETKPGAGFKAYLDTIKPSTPALTAATDEEKKVAQAALDAQTGRVQVPDAAIFTPQVTKPAGNTLTSIATDASNAYKAAEDETKPGAGFRAYLDVVKANLPALTGATDEAKKEAQATLDAGVGRTYLPNSEIFTPQPTKPSLSVTKAVTEPKTPADDGQFSEVWDPTTGTYKPKAGGGTLQPPAAPAGGTPPAAKTTATSKSLSDIVSGKLKADIEADQYGLSQETQQAISDRMQKSLKAAYDPIMKNVALDAQRRGVTFGDARTAGEWDVGKEWTQKLADAEAQVAIDAATRASADKRAMLSLGAETGRASDQLALSRETLYGVSPTGEKTLAARGLDLQAAEAYGFGRDPSTGMFSMTLGGRKFNLEEGVTELNKAIARGEATGTFTDPDSGENVQTLKSKLAWAQELGQTTGAKGEPIKTLAGKTYEAEYGPKGLKQQGLDIDKDYYDLAIKKLDLAIEQNDQQGYMEVFKMLLPLIAGNAPGGVTNPGGLLSPGGGAAPGGGKGFSYIDPDTGRTYKFGGENMTAGWAFLKGQGWTDEQISAELKKQGYSDAQIKALNPANKPVDVYQYVPEAAAISGLGRLAKMGLDEVGLEGVGNVVKGAVGGADFYLAVAGTTKLLGSLGVISTEGSVAAAGGVAGTSTTESIMAVAGPAAIFIGGVLAFKAAIDNGWLGNANTKASFIDNLGKFSVEELVGIYGLVEAEGNIKSLGFKSEVFKKQDKKDVLAAIKENIRGRGYRADADPGPPAQAGTGNSLAA